ncbi:hypothetical protein E2C01_087723 [Portunus trituberculatus]|uniref:Uncharacterized protein n=1 Tax=Portunus trituberculatus TaxID=210409 RepID=A0A5B7JE52_PORTR|nr:hypothetical protein [Portunus trituberculatus]
MTSLARPRYTVGLAASLKPLWPWLPRCVTRGGWGVGEAPACRRRFSLGRRERRVPCAALGW